MLRQQGKSATEATSHLERLSVADKKELLFSNGVNRPINKNSLRLMLSALGKKANSL
jgi:hypothetical protein